MAIGPPGIQYLSRLASGSQQLRGPTFALVRRLPPQPLSFVLKVWDFELIDNFSHVVSDTDQSKLTAYFQ